jgi:hypothetical protein
VNSLRIDSCVHSLRCDSGGDDDAICDDPPSDRFFKHDLSGSLVGVDAPDFDLRTACFGDASLGITFAELLRDELFHGSPLGGVTGAAPFPAIPPKLDVACGGILSHNLPKFPKLHSKLNPISRRHPWNQDTLWTSQQWHCPEQTTPTLALVFHCSITVQYTGGLQHLGLLKQTRSGSSSLLLEINEGSDHEYQPTSMMVSSRAN